MAASKAALEHGAVDDAAIMQFIAAFMCGGSGADASAHGEPAAAPSGSRHSSSGTGNRADGQHEVAAVADVLNRLSAQESTRQSAPDQQRSNHPAAAIGSSGRTAADAIASGQFNWADGLPLAEATSAQGTTESGVTDEQQEQQRLPVNGTAEAAQAMLSGQFQWGSGGSVPQPLPAAPAEEVKCHVTDAL